jgi:16S rRNA (adenine(1408)-N(1))-methyltransferase
MITLKGGKKVEILPNQFKEILNKFDRVVLDIGTGDGKFVYKNALKHPKTLFIGMDPLTSQMSEYESKINRKKLNNTLLIVGSIEKIPTDLFSYIDRIYINLPWGSLLEKIIKAENTHIKDIHSLLKKDGEIEMTFGYDPEHEPTEVQRLNLPNIISKKDIEKILSNFREYFEIVELSRLSKNELGEIDTTWAKKLKFGKDRVIHKIILKKK